MKKNNSNSTDKVNAKLTMAKKMQVEHSSGRKFMLPPGFQKVNNMLHIVHTVKSGEETFEKTEMLCRHVPIISKKLLNIAHSQLHFELSWRDNDREYNEVVPASYVASKSDLLKLADWSLGVNDLNARNLISYFDDFLIFNNVPTSRVAEQLGNFKNEIIHPLASNDINIVPADLGEKQILNAFQTAGTYQEWLKKVFQMIQDHPKALAMVLASFASVILKDLNLEPFTVDMSGSTSRGKTTVLKVAASVWGTEHLIHEWNGTKISFERKAAFLNNFPLILDDTMKADASELQNILYTHSGGRSRSRASIVGSQNELTWNNFILSSGEVPLPEYAQRAGGAAARVLPINGNPFKEIRSGFFTELYENMGSNYGSIGLEFIKRWNSQKIEWFPAYKKLRSLYQNIAEGNDVTIRIARHFAAIHFAGELLNEFFEAQIELELMEKLFQEIMQNNTAVDKPMQMLESILVDLDATRHTISENSMPKEMKAIYKSGTLFLLPAYLKEFLKLEALPIRKEWLDRGISAKHEKHGKTSDTMQLKHLNKNYRVVAINPVIISELDYDFSSSIPKK